jgi:hypothetical protein
MGPQIIDNPASRGVFASPVCRSHRIEAVKVRIEFDNATKYTAFEKIMQGYVVGIPAAVLEDSQDTLTGFGERDKFVAFFGRRTEWFFDND